MDVVSHAPGTFCWVELTTTDASRAKAFYSNLFGWEYGDNPMGPDMVYTMCCLEGKSLGGLFQMHDSNVPPHWGLYVRVESADATAAKSREMGGAVLMEPFDVAEHGRSAVITDPSGAIFQVWEPKHHIGYEVVGVPGTHCWSELLSPDTDGAKDFYSKLFGWTADESMSGYTMFKQGDNGMSVAGMTAMTPEMGNVPPNWSPYFYVPNADAIAETAKANGGRVLHDPQDVPGMVRFAMIMDPLGAVFGIFHPLNSPTNGDNP